VVEPDSRCIRHLDRPAEHDVRLDEDAVNAQSPSFMTGDGVRDFVRRPSVRSRSTGVARLVRRVVGNLAQGRRELLRAIVSKHRGSLPAFLTQTNECIRNLRAGARLNDRFEGRERLVRARLGSLVMRTRFAFATTEGF
jgi:hypothetical protein